MTSPRTVQTSQTSKSTYLTLDLLIAIVSFHIMALLSLLLLLLQLHFSDTAADPIAVYCRPTGNYTTACTNPTLASSLILSHPQTPTSPQMPKAQFQTEPMD